MVQWRHCLVLVTLLLLLPPMSKSQEEADDDYTQKDEDHGDDDGDEDDEPEKSEDNVGRRAPPILLQTSRTIPVTRTTKMRPLECYVCAYKSETPLKACLDPTKYRVQTITCHSVDDKCSTTVISKGSSTFEAVVRGCKSACIGSPETTCCDLNRCNNQAFAIPAVVAPRALVQESKSSKTIPHSVLFFVTILLVLQTVVKVTFI